MLEPSDLDVTVKMPDGLFRIVKQNLVNLTPWHILSREVALRRLHGIRDRYTPKYVPFAWRQDRDELACVEPDHPDRIVIVCASEPKGYERGETYDSFWDWFRAAVEETIIWE